MKKRTIILNENDVALIYRAKDDTHELIPSRKEYKQECSLFEEDAFDNLYILYNMLDWDNDSRLTNLIDKKYDKYYDENWVNEIERDTSNDIPVFSLESLGCIKFHNGKK
jgi:hypothetical protein